MPYDVDGKFKNPFLMYTVVEGVSFFASNHVKVLIFNEGGTRCAALQSKRNAGAVFLRFLRNPLHCGTVGGGI